ncbi:MAG: hypothetical protein KAS32_13820 [Candidatus Peribacteraceae bacterium]|nr:hypothetical protein [Candidatus Peribacteraceae bacterium]
MAWADVWNAQLKLNELFIEGFENLSGRVGLNTTLIVIIIIWLLILTYKIFKKQK